MKTIQIILMGIFIGLLAAGLILVVASEPRGKAIELVPVITPSEIVIYISGAVKEPGVYTLAPDSRVEQAVAAAGGFTMEVDASRANLAARLSDGQQVYIYKIDDPESGKGENPVNIQPVDINTATLEELDAIPGIGMTKAQSIITYRVSHGSFTSLEDLLNVPGIGPSLLEQITPYITLGS